MVDEIIKSEKVDVQTISTREFKENLEETMVKIVSMKNKGYEDETIATKLEMTKNQVKYLYDKYLNNSIRALAKRKNIVAEQNMVYKKRLAEAEENYERAKRLCDDCEGKLNTQAAVAAWHKIVVETADSYTDYLTKIGAINPDTYKEFALEEEIKKEKSPLEILIEANRKKLMEEIEKAKKAGEDGSTPTQSP